MVHTWKPGASAQRSFPSLPDTTHQQFQDLSIDACIFGDITHRVADNVKEHFATPGLPYAEGFSGKVWVVICPSNGKGRELVHEGGLEILEELGRFQLS